MRSFRFVFFVAVPLGVMTFVAFACSSQATLVGQGGSCQLATDCEDGLICAPQSGKSCPCICTNNLNGIEQLPPTPDGGAGLPAGDATANDDVVGLIPTSVDAAGTGD